MNTKFDDLKVVWIRESLDNGAVVSCDNLGAFWYDDQGQRHRDDGPAIMYASGTESWYRHGLMHREGGPASISKAYKCWYICGKRHRDDGPAVVRSNGAKEWWVLGQRHRDDGPALVTPDKKEWFLNGKRHREDGPAVEKKGSCNWALDGTYFTEANWRKQMNMADAGQVTEELQDRLSEVYDAFFDSEEEKAALTTQNVVLAKENEELKQALMMSRRRIE